jgi:hypothetical protein
MYDPTIGVFLSEDPTELESGDVNFRRYVGNDPVSHNDPYGLQENAPGKPKSPGDLKEGDFPEKPVPNDKEGGRTGYKPIIKLGFDPAKKVGNEFVVRVTLAVYEIDFDPTTSYRVPGRFNDDVLRHECEHLRFGQYLARKFFERMKTVVVEGRGKTADLARKDAETKMYAEIGKFNKFFEAAQGYYDEFTGNGNPIEQGCWEKQKKIYEKVWGFFPNLPRGPKYDGLPLTIPDMEELK